MDRIIKSSFHSKRAKRLPVPASELYKGYILTPRPPLRPASVYPSPLLRGEDTLARRRGGGGVNILEDERDRIALLQ